MVANAWVETDATDDGGRVESLDLGIGIQLVKVADTKGEIGVGKELHGLGFLESHEQGLYVFLDGSLLQQLSKGVGCLFEVIACNSTDSPILFIELLYHLGEAYDDAAWVEVIVEGLALAQELGREQEAELAGGVVATFLEQLGILHVQ